MKKEPIWIVCNDTLKGNDIVAVGNSDEITIYLYSQRLEFSHWLFRLERWESINKCTQTIYGKEYENWDRFLDEFEREDCTQEHEIVHANDSPNTDYGFFGWNKN